MKKIIAPVSRKNILEELTYEKFVRKTNNGGNELYIVNYVNSPMIMREIGRLREISFRAAGGGTGKEIDIDEFDTSEYPYQQLIVWDPDAREILGGYRFILGQGPDGKEMIPEMLATSEMFRFSDQFIREYLPLTIELGRSFVQPDYQSTARSRKSLYALDNLWDGLGALVVMNPHVKYFFGKVTMYPHFNRKARNMILHFLNEHFPDPDNLITPIKPVCIEADEKEVSEFFSGETFRDNYKILSQKVRALGENIPPLFNAYINLSDSLRVFGTAVNKSFGNVEETAMMVTIPDIYPSKVERHISTFDLDKDERVREDDQ
ncbi:MAG TPA: GNAT family N-acetyltransferase [Bacteroidetes bacterium]|mgnify:CR=1 FL=1|nr:GNAT family N-acetyltransferase [Bacteroidota bacterium]